MQTPVRRSAGFTLIEIMAVVLIIGLLGGIVGVVIFGQVDSARVTTARTQMKQIESALEFYRLDNGRYPTTEQGLRALIEKPGTTPEPRRWRPEGYLQGGAVPADPWGEPFLYEQPGTQNARSFDLWSLGADASPGGEDVNADIGNWAEDEGV
jgi:general secretion pathway protein G